MNNFIIIYLEESKKWVLLKSNVLFLRVSVETVVKWQGRSQFVFASVRTGHQ